MTVIKDPGNAPNSYSDAQVRLWPDTAGLWKTAYNGKVSELATMTTNYNNEVTAYNNEVTAYNNGHLFIRSLGSGSVITVGNGGGSGYYPFADGTSTFTAPITGTYIVFAHCESTSELGSGSFQTQVEIAGTIVTDRKFTIENNAAQLHWTWQGSVSAGQSIRFKMVNNTGASKGFPNNPGAAEVIIAYAAVAS